MYNSNIKALHLNKILKNFSKVMNDYGFIIGINKCQEAILTAIPNDFSKFKKKNHLDKEEKTLHNQGSSRSLSSLNGGLEKNLLEELYPDRLFLQECMADPILMENDQVADLVRAGNNFFEQRLEFWKCRNPVS